MPTLEEKYIELCARMMVLESRVKELEQTESCWLSAAEAANKLSDAGCKITAFTLKKYARQAQSDDGPFENGHHCSLSSTRWTFHLQRCLIRLREFNEARWRRA
ncbi:MAG: hypothetical protein AAGG02_10825 [Cyanobacteria bacterium P01_H01_bin.15]